MKKFNRNNEAAVEAFVGTKAEILERLDLLREYVDDHMGVSPEAVNWGHVGSTQHILAMLKEVSVFAGLESEAE